MIHLHAREIESWFNHAARLMKFRLEPVLKSSGTRKISRIDSLCKNFFNFVLFPLKIWFFRGVTRYVFIFSFFVIFSFGSVRSQIPSQIWRIFSSKQVITKCKTTISWYVCKHPDGSTKAVSSLFSNCIWVYGAQLRRLLARRWLDQSIFQFCARVAFEKKMNLRGYHRFRNMDFVG